MTWYRVAGFDHFAYLMESSNRQLSGEKSQWKLPSVAPWILHPINNIVSRCIVLSLYFLPYWHVITQSQPSLSLHDMMWSGATTADACFAECNYTQQRRLCTRQSLCRVLHSAKSCRHIPSRQRLLCRVLFVGHSVKPLPSAEKAPGKYLHSVK